MLAYTHRGSFEIQNSNVTTICSPNQHQGQHRLNFMSGLIVDLNAREEHTWSSQ